MTRPTKETVNQYALLIESELEDNTNQNCLDKFPKTTTAKDRGSKGYGKDGKGKDRVKEPCYFFTETNEGCNKGQIKPEEQRC